MTEVTLYTGTFQTTAYWSYIVYGNINTYLPKDFQNIPYKGFADVTYGGIYKYNSRIQMPLEISDMKNIIVLNGSQIITFHIEEKNTDIEKGIISGVYSSVNPFDHGIFALTKE